MSEMQPQSGRPSNAPQKPNWAAERLRPNTQSPPQQTGTPEEIAENFLKKLRNPSASTEPFKNELIESFRTALTENPYLAHIEDQQVHTNIMDLVKSEGGIADKLIASFDAKALLAQTDDAQALREHLSNGLSHIAQKLPPQALVETNAQANTTTIESKLAEIAKNPMTLATKLIDASKAEFAELAARKIANAPKPEIVAEAPKELDELMTENLELTNRVLRHQTKRLPPEKPKSNVKANTATLQENEQKLERGFIKAFKEADTPMKVEASINFAFVAFSAFMAASHAKHMFDPVQTYDPKTGEIKVEKKFHFDQATWAAINTAVAGGLAYLGHQRLTNPQMGI
jgi:hypothetical protein